MRKLVFPVAAGLAAFLFFPIFESRAQGQISPDMVFNLSGLGNAHALFDGDPNTVFEPKHQAGFTATPATVVLRMNPEASDCGLTKIRFEVAPGASGGIRVFAGEPGEGNWTEMTGGLQPFGNQIVALEWLPVLQGVRFLKFVFEKPGEAFPQNFKTGEISLTTSGGCFYKDEFTACEIPGDCPNNNLPLGERMGVNNFVGKSQLYYQTGPFENVREYLPWDHVQGHFSSGNTSPNAGEQPFRFAPCFPGYDLDRHYQNLSKFGRSVLGTFKESSPFQLAFNYFSGDNPLTMNQLGMNYGSLGQGYLDLMERKPGRPSNGVSPNNPQFSSPETYAGHALALQQIALRYGRNGEMQNVKFDDENRANQGSIAFIENWNEQDKWWLQPNAQAPVNQDFERRLAYFTPQEYMAMTLADRHDNGGLALPLIMSGLTEFDAEWLRGAFMAWWELTGEDPANTFPFHALNFHHYSVENWQNGLMPEADPELQPGNPASGLNRIIAFRNNHLPGQEIWVTEFGFSDHAEDATAAIPNYPNADLEEVQAQWLVRNYLIFNRLGVDRAFTYQLTDDGPNQWHGYFNHTGVVDRTDNGGWIPEFRYKKSWYYLFALRQMFGDQFFKNAATATTQNGRPVEIYSFENQNVTQKIRALWIPQDLNPGFEKLEISVVPGSKIELVELANGSISGAKTEMTDADGDGKILLENVSERPIFVVEGIQTDATSCNCAAPLTLISGEQNAFAALTAETSQILAEKHPRCDYGQDMAQLWQGDAGTLTVNIGGGQTDDEFLVEGFFTHDPAGQDGLATVEFLDKNGTTVSEFNLELNAPAIYPFNATGGNFTWQRVENQRIMAAQIRISKTSGAAIGEFIVCARGLENGNSTTPPPPPPPPAGTDCACKPVPVSVSPSQVFYDLRPGQTLPANATTWDGCADASPDKTPFRMFDEQNLLNSLCENGYEIGTGPADFINCGQASAANFPVREWFPGWAGGSAQYPFSAVVHFDNSQIFNGLYLYDNNDEGRLSIEYRESETDAWKQLPLPDGKSYLTKNWHKWVKIFHSNADLTASDLRVTVKDEHAHFSEIALCKNGSVRRSQLADFQEIGTENETQTNERNSSLITNNSSLKIYPNPTSGLLNIAPGDLKFSNFSLTDVAGRVLSDFQNSGEEVSQSIDLQGFARGVYFLVFYDFGKIVWRERVVLE